MGPRAERDERVHVLGGMRGRWAGGACAVLNFMRQARGVERGGKILNPNPNRDRNPNLSINLDSNPNPNLNPNLDPLNPTSTSTSTPTLWFV